VIPRFNEFEKVSKIDLSDKLPIIFKEDFI
jgi:hypothetical protein